MLENRNTSIALVEVVKDRSEYACCDAIGPAD